MPRVRPARLRDLRVLLLAAAGVVLACGPDAPAAPETAAEPVPPAQTHAVAGLAPGPHDQAVLDLGALGTIRVELLPELAPRTVAEFVALAESGAYDGTTFHRVIPGFMIQGGDPLSRNLDPRDDGRGAPGPEIPDEFSDYPHQRGTVSMANSGYRNSGTGQFFIVQQDTRALDGHYTAFGRVVSGMETVDAVTGLEIDRYGRYGPPNRPYPVDARIVRVRIERADAAAAADAPPAPAATSTAAASPAPTGSAAPPADAG